MWYIVAELNIIVADNFADFGKKVNQHINEIRNTDIDYIIPVKLMRFNNGEGKVVITKSIRDKDLYILSDVSNYNISYKFFGKDHYMGPDEHFQDIKRILSAECGHASKRTIIMPYLYQSRQDKKDSRESLDCANALQELSYMGANEIITCDVHNKGVMNAVPNMAFENMYLGDMMILDLLANEKISDFNNLMCISPDEGAMKRARFFSELLGNVQIGSFYKQRDYTKLIDGKHPIVDHRFLGPSNMEGKTCIIVDDMIASGSSILDTAKLLKKLGVSKIYLMVTFSLFTNGCDKFDEYYKQGIIDRVYASNVSYVPEEIVNKEWFKLVDCSYKMAVLINDLNYGKSVGDLINYREDVSLKIKKLRREK